MSSKTQSSSVFPTSLLLTFQRSLKLGITNFWRNKFLSLATILVIAVILFIFNVILAVHFITNQGLQDISARVDFPIDLKSDLSLYDVQNLITDLKKIDDIRAITFRSKEEALEIVAKTHPETVTFQKKFGLPNPLWPSLIISPKNSEAYPKVLNFLKDSPYKTLLRNNEVNISIAEGNIIASAGENLNHIQGFVRQIIFWIIVAFVSGGTLVIVNAIQLTIYTRRQEITIMRLVGATPNFIRLPYLVEGVLYAFFSVICSVIFLLILAKTIQIQHGNLWQYYEQLRLETLVGTELFLTLILGIISSYSATEQYIKGKLILH